MSYCRDALKLLKRKVICGKDCPIYGNCPRLILEDATDIAIEKAIKAMLRSYLSGKKIKDSPDTMER